MNIPWIEKYRPKTLDEVVGNPEIVDAFKIFADDENMPHIILTGTPGIGKTTVANALIHQIFRESPGKMKESTLELNASDERGIDVVRVKIKGFLQKKLANTRFLILDESDSMTTQAQQSMRTLLERFSTAKFIFICNDISKISDTIQSRCAILRLSPLTAEDIAVIVRRTSEKEGLEICEKSVQRIAETAEGDARQALNLLQTVAAISKRVSIDVVQRMSHIPPIETVQKIFASSTPQKEAVHLLDSLFGDGYSAEDISKMIFRLGKEKGEVSLLEMASGLLMKLSDTLSKVHFYAALMRYKAPRAGNALKKY
ncbi:replication factor C subunit 2/4 [Nematocida major]|uniref:replication factor C subunit 2/4 n=1 Tax=Nematocida major TaxID=1912982 RepID=UPI002008D6C5|nr:replication factor C subunit 2/4 [Nematocida major]KAH9387273.1 replication factor C subunit 2/4 [Nematocida major]